MLRKIRSASRGAYMGRWKRVFNSPRKRVLVREGSSSPRRGGGSGDGTAELFTALVWVFVVVVAVVVIVEFWPWLVGAGLLYGAYAHWIK